MAAGGIFGGQNWHLSCLSLAACTVYVRSLIWCILFNLPYIMASVCTVSLLVQLQRHGKILLRSVWMVTWIGFGPSMFIIWKGFNAVIPAVNPLNSELNPNCKSQLSKIFCGVFKFCACFLKNLNILRTKRDKSVKQKAFCGEGNRHCSECLKNAIISLLLNGEDKFRNELVNIYVLLFTLWSRLQLFAWRTDEKMSYKVFFVW